MCGEVFSSKFSESVKARVDQPHPLALPGRWLVIYTGRSPDEPDFGARSGFATKAEAERRLAEVRRRGVKADWRVLPPAETFGDHDAGRLDQAELLALGNAILNNDQASFEVLRQAYADKTRVPGGRRAAEPEPTDTERVAKAYRTRIKAADALVRFLTDETGREGNPGDYVDPDHEAGHDSELHIENDLLDHLGYAHPVDGYEGGAVDYLRDLIRAYQNADE